MNIFDIFHLIASNIWLYGIPFLFVLTLLVFVHEWGHYIVARMCGVRVESFSIGFGKEIFGFTDKAGTRWKFSLVPLGGYVQMFGDTDPASAGHDEEVEDADSQEKRPMTPEEKKHAFFSKPVWKRAAIVFAGPAINFLFAIVLFVGLYSAVGKTVTPPTATAIMQGSAADLAGFQPHDKIIKINGQEINRFEQIRRIVMIAINDELTFQVNRDGQIIDLKASPDVVEREDHFGFEHAYGFLGVIGPNNGINISNIVAVNDTSVQSVSEARSILSERMGQVTKITVNNGANDETLIIRPMTDVNSALLNKAENAQSDSPTSVAEEAMDVPAPISEDRILYISSGDVEQLVRFNIAESINASVQETWEITAGTMTALWQIISGSRSATELGGIIRIGAIAGDMAQAGLIALVSFTAILSINLGLINLFPIPMLDGGHLVFYAIEAVKGGPLSEQIQEYAFRFGLALLVGIMLFANLNDIVQIIS